MNEHYPFINFPLPYAYDAMEPYIDAKTMELHHGRHLQTYINSLNAALKNYPFLHSWTLEQLLTNIPSLPREIQTAVNRNAGGVFNHRFYFSNLQNPAPQQPDGFLNDAILSAFGDFQMFQSILKSAALSVFGSGYAWLVADSFGNLQIIITANQETPLPLGMFPLLNIDVWEHAYYLKHYNLRVNYIDDFFHIINWKKIAQDYQNYISNFYPSSSRTISAVKTTPSAPSASIR